MAGINKVILVGNLGIDPEIYTFDNGNKKTSFRLGTNEAYKNKEGVRIEHTEWHNIVIYGKLADVAAEYLKKGTLIYLEGKIRTRSWEDNGIKKYIQEIECSSFTILSSKKDNEHQMPPAAGEPAAPSVIFDPQGDDLPF